MHPSRPEVGESELAVRWPEAPAIADEEGELAAAFGLGRGRALQLLGPRVWLAGLRAMGAGNGPGRPQGDALRMSGAFLLRAGCIEWSHLSAHAGDIVQPAHVPRGALAE